MTIKHIVLCGGGPVGLISYGAVKELIHNKHIIYENIKSIYSTSSGCFIALIILLNLKFEWIDDYIIKRPWENLIDFTSSDYLNLFFTKGLCDENFIVNCLKPLFLAADISINITLKEFYEINKIDWHIFTSNLNKFCKVDLNHKTYPDLTLIEAINMSSSIPILIKPPFYNNEYYLDGGIFCNCPSYECLINEKCNENEIICFTNDKRYPLDLSYNNFTNIENKYNNNHSLNKNTNIFIFLLYILKKVFKKIIIIGNENTIIIKNSINICITPHHIDINYWNYVFTNKEERKRLINIGKSQAINYINNINNNFDSSYNIIFNNNNTNNNDNNNDNNNTNNNDNNDTNYTNDTNDTYNDNTNDTNNDSK